MFNRSPAARGSWADRAAVVPDRGTGRAGSPGPRGTACTSRTRAVAAREVWPSNRPGRASPGRVNKRLEGHGI